MPGPEQNFYRTQVKPYLDAQPDVFWFKVHGSAYQQAGLPDILLCVGGRFAGIELKAEGGEATPAQARILRRIAAAGGTAVVCTTLAGVEAVVTSLRPTLMTYLGGDT